MRQKVVRVVALSLTLTIANTSFAAIPRPPLTIKKIIRALGDFITVPVPAPAPRPATQQP